MHFPLLRGGRISTIVRNWNKNKKQQIPGKCPGEFTDAESGRKLLREKKGTGRGFAELE